MRAVVWSLLVALAAVPVAGQTAPAVSAGNGTLYLGAFPHRIFVIDEASAQVVQEIDVPRGAPRSMVLSEDHNFWIDFNSTYKVRRVVMQLGRRFTEANFIEQAADVFYLHFDEVRQVDADQRALVAKRRAIFEHFRAIKPPPRLGVEPPPKEEDEEDSDS